MNAPLVATVENMRLVERVPGVFAYDYASGSRYSATPGDYFWLASGEALANEDGEALLLLVEHRSLHDAFDAATGEGRR